MRLAKAIQYWVQQEITARLSTFTVGGYVQAERLVGSVPTDVQIPLPDYYIEFVIDGGGAPITSGVKGDIQVPAGTIKEVQLVADQAGNIVVDVWKDTFENFPPTAADSICGGTKPSLSGAQAYRDSALSGWTTQLNNGDWLRFNVDSASIVQRVTITLKVSRNG